MQRSEPAFTVGLLCWSFIYLSSTNSTTRSCWLCRRHLRGSTPAHDHRPSDCCACHFDGQTIVQHCFLPTMQPVVFAHRAIFSACFAAYIIYEHVFVTKESVLCRFFFNHRRSNFLPDCAGVISVCLVSSDILSSPVTTNYAKVHTARLH